MAQVLCTTHGYTLQVELKKSFNNNKIKFMKFETNRKLD